MERNEVKRIVIMSSLGTLLAIIVIGVGGYFIYTNYLAGWVEQYKIAQQSKSIVEEVGKAVLLPQDETPQVSKILDAAQLKKGDAFFASAENGDAALLYEKSGLIILFDLEKHKVLNMGMIATSSDDATAATPASGPDSNQ